MPKEEEEEAKGQVPKEKKLDQLIIDPTKGDDLQSRINFNISKMKETEEMDKLRNSTANFNGTSSMRTKEGIDTTEYGAHFKWLGIDVKEMSVLGILNIIDEATMIRFMGRDLTLYLKYIKYQAIMFGVIVIMNWTILLPLYYNGQDAERKFLAQDNSKEDAEGETEKSKGAEYNLIKFTILNVTSDR